MKHGMANSVDPDEMAHNEPSHHDIHCLQKCLLGLKGFKKIQDQTTKLQHCIWLSLLILIIITFCICPQRHIFLCHGLNMMVISVYFLFHSNR